MSKTRKKRTDVYFNGNKNEGRMGGLYPIFITVFDTNMVKLMSYTYSHLVVDDESSYCLPFVDPGDNWFVFFFMNYFYLYKSTSIIDLLSNLYNCRYSSILNKIDPY